MMIYETVTSQGKGVWYKSYSVELITVTTHQSYRMRQTEKVTTTYEVRFRENDPEGKEDKRIFSSPEARTAFLEEAFTDLTLQPSCEERVIPSELSALAGCRLVSITFILDYLQLVFEGEQHSHHFNLFQFPILVTPSQSHDVTAWGYADVLRTFIDKSVTHAEKYADVGLLWEFGNDYRIELSLYSESVIELVTYSRSSDSLFQVWFATNE